MKRDFTLSVYKDLLCSLKETGYEFLTFRDFLLSPKNKVVILRHDVDLKPQNSLQTAIIENKLGILGSYYFRIIPESFDTAIIKKIAELGHEIGYHYEDVDLTLKQPKTKNQEPRAQNPEFKTDLLIDDAFELFRKNLSRFEQFYPVKTICMHGSPLSKYDNKLIWTKYSYKDLGLIGEPYFDVDFSKVLYLTDTGRCWNGERFSVRDKVQDYRFKIQGLRKNKGALHKTFDIINSIKSGLMPNQIMITVHPQRWNNGILSWTKELVWQNIKNIAKAFIVNRKSD